MRYRIAKQFHFSASHTLEGLPEGHPCARLHGHNYVVWLELESDSLDEFGFVVDYGKLGEFKDWLDETFDHQHLNHVLNFQPSAENLARYFYLHARRMLFAQDDELRRVCAVRVSETPKTWAEYRE